MRIPIHPVAPTLLRTAPGAAETATRMLRIRILRFDPRQPETLPHWQTYELQDAAGMTLFIALSEIREKLDPSLQFDFVCRAGICGSCAMLIDGRPGLACKTLTKNLGAEFTLAPLPVFALIGDLSVDTGNWMRGMSERLQTWVHQQESTPDLTRLEARMEPELAEASLNMTHERERQGAGSKSKQAVMC
jgi:fumarate reductase iron-sulfur subunit